VRKGEPEEDEEAGIVQDEEDSEDDAEVPLHFMSLLLAFIESYLTVEHQECIFNIDSLIRTKKKSLKPPKNRAAFQDHIKPR
jgi:hypothetical protein